MILHECGLIPDKKRDWSASFSYTHEIHKTDTPSPQLLQAFPGSPRCQTARGFARQILLLWASFSRCPLYLACSPTALLESSALSTFFAFLLCSLMEQPVIPAQMLPDWGQPLIAQ